MARKRDFKLEYQRRIARGIAAGKSRSAARGHWRALDLPKLATPTIERSSALEQGLKHMRRGMSQSAAAKAVGVSVERLRRYRGQNTSSQRARGKWVIFDSRPQAFWIASEGKFATVTLPNDEGSQVSTYWRAVDKFLYSNDVDHLFPFEGEGVFDVRGRFHQFETRPNVLRKLEAIGELNFIEIYADVQ